MLSCTQQRGSQLSIMHGIMVQRPSLYFSRRKAQMHWNINAYVILSFLNPIIGPCVSNSAINSAFQTSLTLYKIGLLNLCQRFNICHWKLQLVVIMVCKEKEEEEEEVVLNNPCNEGSTWIFINLALSARLITCYALT